MGGAPCGSSGCPQCGGVVVQTQMFASGYTGLPCREMFPIYIWGGQCIGIGGGQQLVDSDGLSYGGISHENLRYFDLLDIYFVSKRLRASWDLGKI